MATSVRPLALFGAAVLCVLCGSSCGVPKPPSAPSSGGPNDARRIQEIERELAGKDDLFVSKFLAPAVFPRTGRSRR
jgi:hypothetical protein